MKKYTEMDNGELSAEKERLLSVYNDFKAKRLKLDMSRGKPAAEQLELSMELLETITTDECCNNPDGVDYRNYGVADGLLSAKKFFSELLGAEPENIFVGGNSSLEMMFDLVSQALLTGLGGEPWSRYKDVKFLCPVPGYDRHFAIFEYLGIKMLNIRIVGNELDMDEVERLVADESVKGLIIVPKYSNPTGITFSDETVHRLAALKPAAKDFKIIWDNAYCVHDFYEDGDKLLNILDESKKNGNEDMPIVFASTSKLSFPGGGIAACAASPNNIALIKKRSSYQTIGHDKLNQYRHMRFFNSPEKFKEHIKRHAAIIRPKFEIVLKTLDGELAEAGIAKWQEPRGGYFISLDVMDGTAARTIALCKEAGVSLTSAGAPFPYHKDPFDSTIRIAPTYPPVHELEIAASLLCVAARLAAVEKLLG